MEAGEFRRKIADFEKRNTVVLGISPDSPKAQTSFKTKQNLPFTLLCDMDKAVAKAYGATKPLGIARSTFLIGADGKIRRVWTQVKPAGHADEVLAAIEQTSGTTG